MSLVRSDHIDMARRRKVERLTRAIGKLPASVIARHMSATEEGRETLYRLACVHRPSDETWALLIETLEGDERIAAEAPGDPFDFRVHDPIRGD